MSQYRVSERAKADLDDIWDYIAQDNPDMADVLYVLFSPYFRCMHPHLKWDENVRN
jgi:hypothetical protein